MISRQRHKFPAETHIFMQIMQSREPFAKRCLTCFDHQERSQEPRHLPTITDFTVVVDIY